MEFPKNDKSPLQNLKLNCDFETKYFCFAPQFDFSLPKSLISQAAQWDDDNLTPKGSIFHPNSSVCRKLYEKSSN